MLEPRDEEDGLSERMLQRTPQLMKFTLFGSSVYLLKFGFKGT